MNLAIDIYTLLQRVDYKEALSMIKAAGFDAIDYSLYGEETRVLKGNYSEYALKVKEEIEKQQLQCNQAHAPFHLKPGEPWDMSCEAYRNIVYAMEFASILGAKHIVVHPLKYVDQEELLAKNTEYYKSLEPYCEKFGIKIAIENLFIRQEDSYLGCLEQPALLKDLLERLDSPHFCLCVDVGHAGLTGINPEKLISGLEQGSLHALHIQDTDCLGDRHMLPYLGKLSWDAITKALAQIEYAGDFTFEIFGYLRGIETALLPAALTFAAETGRYLISKIEKAGSCSCEQ